MSGTQPHSGSASDRLDRLQTTPRRRFVLSYLTTRRRAVTVDELVTALDAWERVHRDTGTSREQHWVGLRQVHLPVLDEADLVSFDSDADLVELSVDPDGLSSLFDAPVHANPPAEPNGAI
jgi:hypothetical protein